ncbi:MAG: carboxymuconolactone decarboxylase family protein [Planctomycetia bacterium]|nr:carboxymuconolactone decarboxylase family protein [Planctomycetia bacterium]
MAVVSYLSKDDAAEKLRPVFEGMERKLGAVPNMFRAMAHSPELLETFLALNGALSKTKLDPKLRELAYIKTSELNHCEYCLSHHRGFARKAGLSDRQINETSQHETSDAYDDLQRDVLRYAEEVTRHVSAADDLTSRLKASLPDRELVELTITVALANFTNRINEAIKFELP